MRREGAHLKDVVLSWRRSRKGNSMPVRFLHVSLFLLLFSPLFFSFICFFLVLTCFFFFFKKKVHVYAAREAGMSTDKSTGPYTYRKIINLIPKRLHLMIMQRLHHRRIHACRKPGQQRPIRVLQDPILRRNQAPGERERDGNHGDGAVQRARRIVGVYGRKGVRLIDARAC